MVKIILTGPESSGKTTLAKQLSNHFNAPLIAEYARIFLEKKTPPQYFYPDLLKIAKKQLSLEYQSPNHPITQLLLICDTDLITLKIWSNVVFKKCHPWILEQLEKSAHDSQRHYLLCSPEGISWEYDPLRENPNDRDYLFQLYENELMLYKKNYSILRGGISERFETAVLEIKKLL
jgi:nicotinamide riboside kinase